MEKSSKRVVLLAVCAPAVVVVGLVLFWTGRHKAAETTQVTQELAKLRAQVEEVRKGTRGNTYVLQAAPVQPAPAPVSSGDATVQTQADLLKGLDPEERSYRIGVMRDERQKLVEETLRREPVDGGWSTAAVNQLRATYQGEEYAAATYDVTCRSTICELKLTSTDPRAGEQAMRRMIEKVPWQTNGISSFSRMTGEGVVYFAREGTQLPEVDVTSLIF